MTARAAVGVAGVELGMHLVSLPRLCRILGVRVATAGEQAGSELSSRGSREWHAARRVLRHWPAPDTCLRRSLVAGWLLRREHPALRIGVARDGELSLAHAWLELDGQPVGELPSEFAPLHGPRR